MLPKISSQQNQEVVSRNMFRGLVPTELFLVRDEIEHDFGVDFIIEAIIDLENASNFRSHVQLKSTQKYSENKDGTVSYGKISRSNISYLLHQPNSIYVVYFVEKNIFVWEWVDTIKDYATEKGIDLKSTASSEFTYRFSKHLDVQSLKLIHQTIINFGLNIRDFFDDKSVLSSFRGRLLHFDFSSISNSLVEAYHEQKYEEILMFFKDFEEYSLEESILISMCYYSLYRYYDGILFVENALHVHNENVDLLTMKACMLCESGIDEKSNIKITMAKDIFISLLDIEKNYVNYYNLGNAYSALGEYEQAVLAYQKSVEFRADFAMSWKNMGTAYYQQKDFEQASNCYDNALQYNSSLPEALFCKGSLLARDKNYEEALVFYDKVIENKSFAKRCPSIFYWRAYIYFAMREYDLAMKSINMYLPYRPDDLYGMNLKAKIYADMWRQSDDYITAAREYFEGVRVFLSNADWILIELFLLHIEIHNLKSAKDVFEDVLGNHGVSVKIPTLIFEQLCDEPYLLTLLQNMDFYLAFRKMSNINDFKFELLDSDINPLEMFWLLHAIAFCKSMDDAEKIKKNNAKSLSELFDRIFNYVQDSHLLLINYLSRHYFLLNTDKRTSIISSCLVYLYEIWIKEATRIYSWICIRKEVSIDVTNKALDLAMDKFDDSSNFIEPILNGFNSVWKMFKEEKEETE